MEEMREVFERSSKDQKCWQIFGFIIRPDKVIERVETRTG